MTTATRLARAKIRMFKCRFPGCDWKARAPQPRGRHESQAHGMVKGELPSMPDSPETFTQSFVAGFNEADIAELMKGHAGAQVVNGNGHLSPVEHLTAAYADLAERDKVLASEVARLKDLEPEWSECQRSMAIINAALEDIGGRKA